MFLLNGKQLMQDPSRTIGRSPFGGRERHRRYVLPRTEVESTYTVRLSNFDLHTTFGKEDEEKTLKVGESYSGKTREKTASNQYFPEFASRKIRKSGRLKVWASRHIDI